MKGRASSAAARAGPSEEVAASAWETLTVASAALVADRTGAIYWPQERLLAVADLHFEKGSSFAGRGVLLPPYDTAATLAVLGGLMTRYAPRTVLALGDSFHDRTAARRLAPGDREHLKSLQDRRDWVWIAGNHDPAPAPQLGGDFVAALAIGPLTFRHQPRADGQGEISGHLHPVARVAQRGRAVSRRCFATDGSRLVMPALGAYTGGLNVRDRAFADVFGALAFTVHMLGAHRLYAIAARRCLPD